ncbi:pyridoxamine 5'-phosphate oxidase family protein [Fictibacillus iocasae]|uniref:Pyridoxamine 5'-phosphate oxidase family protein n=1 Tax=Fictibacillus iocasae TaxID=2715437 RepID=A0ABW2NV01_9BACL
MDKQELKQNILNVLDESRTGTLATVKGNKPHSRYMTFFHEELTMYSPTSSETHKAEEIEENPNVHILLGYDGDGYGDSYIEAEGTAVIRDDQEIKNKIWNEHMENWFDGKDDPKYVVLEIKPSTIRLMNKKGTDDVQELKL